jgi:hypothetical protein
MPQGKPNRSNTKPSPKTTNNRETQPDRWAHEPADDVTQAVEAGDPRITGRQSGRPSEEAKPPRPESAD